MNGKVARAIRKVTGYKPNVLRNYKKVEAAIEQRLVLDEEATKAMGEPRLKLKPFSKYTWFHNDGARAVYRKVKKDYRLGRIK